MLFFADRDRLVHFVRSGVPHDLAGIDSWPTVVEWLRPHHVTPTEADTYELDFVAENLSGGPDGWIPSLLIKAGEIARDVGYGLGLTDVLAVLAPGGVLDYVDEALRAVELGGFGAGSARRRLKRIPVEEATLAWRGVIGRLASVVDWRS